MLRAVGGCAYQSGAKRSWRSGAAGAHDKTMTTVHNGVDPRAHAVQAAAALAASMGIGRFVYTPILPLMHTQAGLSASLGATLATANYLGYLIGALAGILIPGAVRSAAVMRTSLVVLIATLALMPTTHDGSIWFALRLVAGIASASSS